MKKHFFLLLTFMAITAAAFAGKPAKLTIEYAFKGIEEGYDHTTKAYVFVDGEQVLESPEHKQSIAQSFSISVPSGKRQIKVELWALYEGVWELHVVDNNYSIDCVVDDEFNIKKKGTLKIVFDLDSDTSFSFSGK
jgi:hypothetical protein